jgi:hypothetical protein
MKTLCVCLVALLALVSSVGAQTTNGRIVGSVSDSSLAVIVGAEVTVTHIETGVARRSPTNSDGSYTLSNLPVGTYEVAVERTGFKRFIQRPVRLEVDQTVRLDVVLQPGAVTESVTVEGSVPLVQTDQSSLGGVVENRTIVGLPLNGRNFISLGSLVPGTTAGAPGASVTRGRQEGVALTANGQRAEYNNFILDGADNNESFFGVAVVVPSIDAIQEFKVQTSNYSAEFGRGSGAMVNVSLKSGTNQLHGSVYEFFRNEKFDARNFFAVGLTPLRQNQFGVAAGGPIIRNKLFLFGNYEGQRVRRTSTSGFQVPTAAARQGDFTGLPTVYDPFALDASGARTPFPGNRIPTNRINASSAKLAALWPLPNSSDVARPYTQNFNNPQDRNQFHLRGDYNLSSNDMVMARISWTDRSDQNSNILYNGDVTNNKHKSGVAGWTHTFSPTVLNDARFSATRYNFENLPDGVGTDFTTQLGLPSFATGDLQRFPPVTATGVAGFGGNASIPLLRREYHYQWMDSLTIVRGKQTIKAGLDIRRYGSTNFQPQNSSGSYTFNGNYSGVIGRPYQTGLADMLLGLPAAQSILVPKFFEPNRLRNTRVNAYVQDDINLTPRLTLNLGVRWERDANWTEKNNRWAYFDTTAGQLVYPKALQIPFKLPYSYRAEDITSMKEPTNRAFAPRAGFAYRPFGNNRTVVRAAYGFFWGQPIAVILLNTALTPPPFLLTQAMTSSASTPELRFGVFPGTSGDEFVPKSPTAFTVNPRTYTNGYVQQWNLAMQREVGFQTALTVSYVGNKGTHLERRQQANAALPPAAGSLNNRRFFPAYGSITMQDSSSFSTYHSLQAQGEKRYSNGLSLLAGYTWSKSLDDTSSWIGVGPGDNLAQDPSRIFLEKGLSSFDVRHRFTLSYVYELPFKTGKRALDLVVAGWQSSGLLNFQSGFPTSATIGGDIPNAGTGLTRPNLSAPANLDPGQRNIDRWFNTAAFANPPAYTFGTAGRNIIDGPGTRAFTLSMTKAFRVVEHHQLQLRAEFYNLFNHPLFGLPNTTFGVVGFGTIRGAGGERQLQFGLRYSF